MQVRAPLAGTARFVVPAAVHAREQAIRRQRALAVIVRQCTPFHYLALVRWFDQALAGGDVRRCREVGREHDGSIEADIARIRALETLDIGNEDLADAV